MKEKSIYITRSDLSFWTENTTFVQAPLSVAKNSELSLYVRNGTGVPDILSSRCNVVRYTSLLQLLNDIKVDGHGSIYTSFDFPSMWIAWRLKKKYNCRWTVFLWDPPSLSHRDRFPPLRWAIDFVFRFFARRCDKLVLNIHPGLLDEIGYVPRNGQVELRMQDAFEDMELVEVENGSRNVCEYDFGVLSNWSRAKGGPLVAEALRRMPGRKCLWIGVAPSGQVSDQIDFVGRLPQKEAFERLKKCRVLLAPYLPVRSLKWNYVLKLFEYLQLGRPVIASDNPGNVAVSERYKNRIALFASGDVDDFVDKVSRLLTN